jgi:hypothetical protein
MIFSILTDPSLDLTSCNSIFRVFSESARRPLLRDKLANLIHNSKSSLGLRTNERVDKVRCHTFTSGWHPFSLFKV